MRPLSDYPDADLRIFERPEPPTANEFSSVYLVGICGTGMGSLAGLFADGGYAVSGSDASPWPPMSTRLARQGIPVLEGYDAGHLDPAPDLVVIGNACTPRHVEAAFARENRLPQVSLPEALARYFIGSRSSFVVAGTHGKTTTTSLLIHVFDRSQLNPGYLVGGVMNDRPSSHAIGTGPYFIVEGDEYDSAYFDKRPKFLHYRPSSAIVTSVEFDHADIYSNMDEYIEAFRLFVELIPTDGLLALCADDPKTAALSRFTRSRVVTYGLEPDTVDISAVDIQTDGEGQQFTLVVGGRSVGAMRLSLSGRHNLLNALGVAALALDEGIPVRLLGEALADFGGIQRRQQVRGIVGDVIVVDDFAHHPTAVRATIESVRERWPDRRIISIFEPRSNSSRRKVFEEGYARAFNHASAVFLSTPPFRHNDDPSNFMDIDTIVARIRNSGVHAEIAPDADALLVPILDYLRPGDVALVMSNGGFGNIHDRILSGIAEQ